jgi:hypothetical protein
MLASTNQPTRLFNPKDRHRNCHRSELTQDLFGACVAVFQSVTMDRAPFHRLLLARLVNSVRWESWRFVALFRTDSHRSQAEARLIQSTLSRCIYFKIRVYITLSESTPEASGLSV